MKKIILILFILYLAGCDNNPVNTPSKNYSDSISLLTPKPDTVIPHGNITLYWQEPIADKVIGYTVMVDIDFHNVNAIHYTISVPSGSTRSWKVFATVVNHGDTVSIESPMWQFHTY